MLGEVDVMAVLLIIKRPGQLSWGLSATEIHLSYEDRRVFPCYGQLF
jgi:hypothetical protein